MASGLDPLGEMRSYSTPQPPPTPQKKGKFTHGLPRSPQGKGLHSLLARAELDSLAQRLPIPSDFSTQVQSLPAPEDPVSKKRPRPLFAEEESTLAPPTKLQAVESLTSSTSSISAPPPTPVKVRPQSVTPSPFEMARSQANEGKLMINGQVVKLSFLASGSYRDIYVYTSPSNGRRVVKIFKQEFCANPGKMKKFTETSIENYRKAHDLGVPVESINDDTALQVGYIDQAFIPGEINPSDPKQFEQIRPFFLSSLQNNLPLDLAPSNLRVHEDGTVVLHDFVEEKDEDMDDAKMFVIDAVHKWTEFFAQTHEMNQELTRAFLDSLTEGFENYLFVYDGEKDFKAFNKWKEDRLQSVFLNHSEKR